MPTSQTFPHPPQLLRLRNLFSISSSDDCLSPPDNRTTQSRNEVTVNLRKNFAKSD